MVNNNYAVRISRPHYLSSAAATVLSTIQASVGFFTGREESPRWIRNNDQTCIQQLCYDWPSFQSLLHGISLGHTRLIAILVDRPMENNSVSGLGCSTAERDPKQ